ncbi:MAG: hypothetical protein U9Q68_07085 [Euryarchaeota archaeon]|nr:hypothetical protein [Euryarchaeota archaeon]
MLISQQRASIRYDMLAAFDRGIARRSFNSIFAGSGHGGNLGGVSADPGRGFAPGAAFRTRGQAQRREERWVCGGCGSQDMGVVVAEGIAARVVGCVGARGWLGAGKYSVTPVHSGVGGDR